MKCSAKVSTRRGEHKHVGGIGEELGNGMLSLMPEG